MVVDNFLLTPFIKLISLTNGNLKKTVNAVNETKFRSFPLKLTVTWDLILNTVGTKR